MELRLQHLGLTLLLGVAALAPGTAARAQSDASAAAPMALVISNSNYATLPKLPGCEISANLVTSVLTRVGFKVTRQSNPSNARLGTAIAALGDEAAAVPGGRSLIYFCGYVTSFSERLFLVPVEARLEREADVLSQGIVARLLMSSVAGPTNAAGLVLMDVATTPDQKERPAFDSMLRASDAAHGGLVVAAITPRDAQSPAPLATALPDLLADGRLELRAELGEIGAHPGLARLLMVSRPPAQPSWLLGVAPDVVPTAPPAAAPAGAAANVAAPVAPPLPDLNAAERRRVQLGLQRLGYFKGRINGVFGADTLAAIRRFQTDSEEAATGKLTTRQAEQIMQ